MQEPTTSGRHRFPLSYGQAACVFAVAVGLFLIGAAVFQTSHPRHDTAVVGRWEIAPWYTMPPGWTSSEILVVKPDGTVDFGSRKDMDRGTKTSSVQWFSNGERISIVGASGLGAPITRNARVDDGTFMTNRGIPYYLVGSPAWRREVHPGGPPLKP